MNPPPPEEPEPAPPSRRNRIGVLVGMVAGVVVLCCLGSVALFFIVRGAVSSATSVSDASTPSPSATISEPPANTFNLAPGSTISAASNDGKWEVTVRNPVWRTSNCGRGAGNPAGDLLTVTVEFTVTGGTADINPLLFRYFDSGGAATDVQAGASSGCNVPELSPQNAVQAGGHTWGKITFDVTGGRGGTVEYGDINPEASWIMP